MDGVDNYKLDRMVKERNTKALVTYVEQNGSEEKNFDKVSKAIRALGRGEDSGRAFLEELVLSNLSSLPLKKAAGEALVENGFRPSLVRQLYNKYKSEDSPELRIIIGKMLKHADFNSVFGLVKDDIVRLSYNSIPNYQNVFKRVAFLIPQQTLQTKVVVSQQLKPKIEKALLEENYGQIIQLCSIGREYSSLNEELLTQISNLAGQYKQGRYELEQLGKSVNQGESQLTDTKEEISKYNSEILTVYIIGLSNSNTVGDATLYEYEVAFPGYDPYLGTIPSANHGYLTTPTRYTSKGWCEIRAKKMMEVPVELKEEYGKFVQDWPVYYEITDEQMQDYQVLKEELEETKRQIAKETAALSNLESKNKSIFRQLKSVIYQL